jgi:hypothetical protein
MEERRAIMKSAEQLRLVERVATYANQTSEYLRENIDFGIVDEKGRAVGMRITKWQARIRKETYKADPRFSQRESAIDKFEDGQPVFGFKLHATRGGVCYGALQASHYAATQDEAAAMIEKKISASRKRYANKYGEKNNA